MSMQIPKTLVRGGVVLLAAALCGCLAPPVSSQTVLPAPIPPGTDVPQQGNPATHLIAYLFAGNASGSSSLANRLHFGKITDIDLAFATPPKCASVCNATSDMHFAIEGQSDEEIDGLVQRAHAAGVRVLVSVGGGGGDQRIIQFYNVGQSAALASSLDRFVRQHGFDGVDLDIEDPTNMGRPFLDFTTALTSTFHPEGRMVTAAVAKYLQASMPDEALRQFDLLNIMNYSSLSAAVDALNFYSDDKKLAPSKLVLGVPFFGSNNDDSREESYKDILAAYPYAWNVDTAGGGSLDKGDTFHYVGEKTMALEVQLSRKYGGIMLWELNGDASAPHSLLSVIERNF